MQEVLCGGVGAAARVGACVGVDEVVQESATYFGIRGLLVWCGESCDKV